tara:strand:+ start:1286 stop:1714 length:429 start_codon:yes stop_codon:yes gene_type:complete
MSDTKRVYDNSNSGELWDLIQPNGKSPLGEGRFRARITEGYFEVWPSDALREFFKRAEDAGITLPKRPRGAAPLLKINFHREAYRNRRNDKLESMMDYHKSAFLKALESSDTNIDVYRDALITIGEGSWVSNEQAKFASSHK